MPFLLRRCRRLLPAYYVTLLVFLALHVVADGRWGLLRYSPGEYVSQAVTHVLLVHQLFPSTFFGLNGAYWSLGLEWGSTSHSRSSSPGSLGGDCGARCWP